MLARHMPNEVEPAAPVSMKARQEPLIKAYVVDPDNAWNSRSPSCDGFEPGSRPLIGWRVRCRI